MSQHAAQMGANAIIGMRYDATEVMQGVTEVLCYGTAVLVKQKNFLTRVDFSRDRLPAYVYIALVLAGFCEVIGHLHS